MKADHHYTSTTNARHHLRSSITLKVTAPVWFISLLMGLGGFLYFHHQYVENLPAMIASDADKVAYAASRYLMQREGGQPLQLTQVLREAMQGMHFVAATVSTGLRNMHTGVPVDELLALQKVSRKVPYSNKPVSGSDVLIADLALFHKPYPHIIREQRNSMLLYFAAVFALFALLLAGVTRQVVTKPLRRLLAASNAAWDGDLSVRLAKGSQDECGRLTEFFNRLLDKLQNRQEEFTHAVTVAENADKAKSVLLASMANEIRAPLTTMLGFTALLREGVLLKEDRQHMLNNILRKGEQLQQLIDDVLDMSKIEAGQLQVTTKSTALFDIFREVECQLRPIAEEKGLAFAIRYRWPLPEQVVTDAARFKQVILTLASNAIRFTDDGKVEISAQFDSASALLQLSVTDTGVGMAPDTVEKLFLHVSQGDYANHRLYGGAGLGLYICNSIVSSLGGSISCQSRQGIGSRIDVWLSPGNTDHINWLTKLPAAAIPAIPAALTLQPGSLKGRVLLADGAAESRELFTMYIRRSGATPVIVDDGRQALDRALVEAFDLILLDTQLPVISGLEVAQRLRASGFQRPIVALCVDSLVEDGEKSRQSGFNELLSKPLGLQQFNWVLMRYLQTLDVAAQHETLRIVSGVVDGKNSSSI